MLLLLLLMLLLLRDVGTDDAVVAGFAGNGFSGLEVGELGEEGVERPDDEGSLVTGGR
jgi:hypothetical protein